MSDQTPSGPPGPGVPDLGIPHLEPDESIPPRPEEEIADVARQDPVTPQHPADEGSAAAG